MRAVTNNKKKTKGVVVVVFNLESKQKREGSEGKRVRERKKKPEDLIKHSCGVY
jgi:hypothetical protein